MHSDRTPLLGLPLLAHVYVRLIQAHLSTNCLERECCCKAVDRIFRGLLRCKVEFSKSLLRCKVENLKRINYS